jgi:hypothetical protein
LIHVNLGSRSEDQYRSTGIARPKKCVSKEVAMHTRALGLTASAFILAYGAAGAIAQDRMTPQSDQQQNQSRPMGQDEEGTTGQGGMMHDGMAGRDMMGGGMMRGVMMGRGMMAGSTAGGCPPVMFRMILALMDSDGDGSISLQEFQAAHERIFKAMDSNKDGQLTEEEMLAFMHGARKPAPQH